MTELGYKKILDCIASPICVVEGTASVIQYGNLAFSKAVEVDVATFDQLLPLKYDRDIFLSRLKNVTITKESCSIFSIDVKLRQGNIYICD